MGQDSLSINNQKSTIKNSWPSAASKPAALALRSPAPPSPAFAVCPPLALPPLSRQTARRASSRSPTTTHISRPRAKARLSLHSARDIQERRLVQSRFQSQPGQAREADSRPGPFLPKVLEGALEAVSLSHADKPRPSSFILSDPPGAVNFAVEIWSVLLVWILLV